MNEKQAWEASQIEMTLVHVGVERSTRSAVGLDNIERLDSR
jgi:hypothetical protein